MCLKTDTVLLQYTLHQFQYFITTCLCMVEIYQQMFQSNSFSFVHFDIVASDPNKFRLFIKESLLIKRHQPQLNKTIKSFP